MERLILILLVVFFIYPASVLSDGTYANIGTATGTNGGADAVSWSATYPITIDTFGHYIVPIQPHGTNSLKFAYSNDAGTTWGEITPSSGALLNRGAIIYDSIHDKLHALETSDTTTKYRRYNIIRNSSYQITNIVADPTLTVLTLDNITGCASGTAGNPIILFKDNGANGILATFWSVQKTDCSGVNVLETRGAMITLADSSADGTASNWKALNGTSDEGSGVGPAVIDYNILYTVSSTAAFRQHSAMILGGNTAKADDIYYFNVDSSDTHGFRRLAWNSSSNNWSGSWTARATFGGDINDAQGYNHKKELLSKPVYASGQGKVYVGIARWLDNTNGDTQSIYSVDTSDNVALVSNIYSAGGAHCLYPTFDLAYDSNQDKLYVFYLKTGSASTCGHTYYKTYDSSSFGSETAFFTTASRSVDIPVTYPSRYDDKILFFFRVNKASDASTPPHDIYFGYLSLNTTETADSTSVTSPIAHTSYSDLSSSCIANSSTQVINTSGGEVSLASTLRDDFETPRSPYSILFNTWTTGTWAAGTYTPQPGGTLLVYGTGGAYVLGTTAYNKKTIDFRAKFTAHNFQHIGWTDGTDFSKYIILSTSNNGQLNARVEAGSGETASALGSSYLGSYHNYRIEWGTDVKFYVDDMTTPVATISVNVTDSLKPIISNNTTTAGSDLTIDWINMLVYSTSGTYTSCPLDSSITGAVWGTLTFGTTTPTGTSAAISTRTSSDNSTWSSWSSALNSGDTVTSDAARYLQYRAVLSGTTASSPTLDNLSLSFSEPETSVSSTSNTESRGGGSFSGSVSRPWSVLAPSAPTSNQTFFRDLFIESRGYDVVILQNFLLKSGFFSGPITGYYGFLTNLAIQKFQKSKGLYITGHADLVTRYILNITPLPTILISAGRDLRAGDIGDDVSTLQKILNDLGFSVSTSGLGSKGNETNKFGAGTWRALIKLQKSAGISATGFFGPKTKAYFSTLGY